MSSGDDRSWPFLSPARTGWWLVSGARGRLRRMLAGEGGRAPHDDPLLVVLDALADVDQVMHAAETDVLVLVAEAYRRGASWADIARRLGRSKQSVHQRYQARVHAPRTRELLAGDLSDAISRARQLCRRDPWDREVVESRAFLRERGVPPRPPGPARSR